MSRREPFHSKLFSRTLAWGVAVALAFLIVAAPRLKAQAPILTTIFSGNNPQAVAVNPVTNTIYVANAADGTVTVFDGASATELAS